MRRRVAGVGWYVEKQAMLHTKATPNHSELHAPPFDCLSDEEKDGGRWVGDYYITQICGEDVVYAEDGLPTYLSVAEAIAISRLGDDALHAHEFLAKVRHANAGLDQARRELAKTPATPLHVAMRAAWAWRIIMLQSQGDALAALLARTAAVVKASFSGASDKIEASTTAPPPRASDLVGARPIASITITPRVLSQRPITARATRAGCLLT